MKKTLFIESKVSGVKKFYFLEYFYILLKSVESYNVERDIFESFRIYKDSFKLGESKYKRLLQVDNELTRKKLIRYEYTFKEVLEESELYRLVDKKGDEFFLTDAGTDLIKKFEHNLPEYHMILLNLIESNLYGFYYLVDKCYSSNKKKNGLLIFPIYSPPKLNIQKSDIIKTKDVIQYINILAKKLKSDAIEHLDLNLDFEKPKHQLISRLINSRLLEDSSEAFFDHKNYNTILKRIRDYWLSHFLNEVYKIQMSLSFFDIWCYRGKQLGIVNVTEFYYNFDGKIIYPISILANKVTNSDFSLVYEYSDEIKLYTHTPTFSSIQEQFTKLIYECYLDLKRKYKTYFISLADLRELVCFKLKISYQSFAVFLESLYQLNLRNEIRIKISLEADKLPSETKATYVKREPILVDGRICNIIAVDIKK